MANKLQLGTMPANMMVSHFVGQHQRATHAKASMKASAMASHPSAGSRKEAFMMSAVYHAGTAANYDTNVRQAERAIAPAEKLGDRRSVFTAASIAHKAIQN